MESRKVKVRRKSDREQAIACSRFAYVLMLKECIDGGVILPIRNGVGLFSAIET